LVPMIIVGVLGLVCGLVGLWFWITNQDSVLLNTETKELQTLHERIPFQSIVAINLQDYVHLQPTQFGDVPIARYAVSAGLAHQDEYAAALFRDTLEKLSTQNPELAQKIRKGVKDHPAQITAKQQPLSAHFSPLVSLETAEFIAQTLAVPLFDLCSPRLLMERSTDELTLSLRELIQKKKPELPEPTKPPEGIEAKDDKALFQAKWNKKNTLTADNKTVTLQQGSKKQEIEISRIKTIYAQTIAKNFLIIFSHDGMISWQMDTTEQTNWLRDALVHFIANLPIEPTHSAVPFR
jgi:hypothetical protein